MVCMRRDYSYRAVILVTLAVVGCVRAPRARREHDPAAGRDSQSCGSSRTISRRAILFHGPGGVSGAARQGRSIHMGGDRYHGLQSRLRSAGPDGRTWDAKLGPEAQSEVVASRVLWAIGYHQPATYYVSNWQLSGGPGGAAAGRAVPARTGRGRSRRRLVLGRQRVRRHSAVPWADRREHSAEQLGLEDDEQQDLSQQERRVAGTRFVVRDVGASLGKTQSSRLLWILPIPVRGFGQGSRNNIDDFESQRFIERVGRRPSRVRFPHDLRIGRGSRHALRTCAGRRICCNRFTDAQWDDAFRAAGLQPGCQSAFHPEDQGEDC